MNVELKIASKAIAYRLRKIIPDLIHPDQTAYVKGRDIGESVIEDMLTKKIWKIFLQQTLKKPLILLSMVLFLLYSKNLLLGLILCSGFKLCSVMHRAVL